MKVGDEKIRTWNLAKKLRMALLSVSTDRPATHFFPLGWRYR
jgi:hypothetical protein